MKQDIKYIIIDALTSGQYKQGTGRLKNEDKYCCLGVICDLHHKMTGKGKWINYDQYETPFGCYVGILAPEVREWAGIQYDAGNYGYGHQSLIRDNDSGKSFMEIAEIIEENF